MDFTNNDFDPPMASGDVEETDEEEEISSPDLE